MARVVCCFVSLSAVTQDALQSWQPGGGGGGGGGGRGRYGGEFVSGNLNGRWDGAALSWATAGSDDDNNTPQQQQQ